MISSTRLPSTGPHSTRTTGTADTLIEVGRFLLEARAASRRAAGAARFPAPRPGSRPRPDTGSAADA